MFEYVLITDKSELVQHKQAIQGLFSECFNKELNENIWTWSYLDNVCGSPIVSLCYNEQGKLVGHYAVIPISLQSLNPNHKFMLSMTTMVDKDVRRYGLFVKQAKLVYEEARKSGYSYIYGFPNKNSLPGFRKRLGWKIEDDYVAIVNKKQLLDSEGFNRYIDEVGCLGFNIANMEVADWRLSKPCASYISRGGLVVKEYGDVNDVVYIDKNAIGTLDDDTRYHILIDGSIPDFLDSKVFSYPFGYLSLVDETDILKIKKDLLLSDVF